MQAQELSVADIPMGNDEDMYHAAGSGDVHRVKELLDWGASLLYKAHGVRNEP